MKKLNAPVIFIICLLLYFVIFYAFNGKLELIVTLILYALAFCALIFVVLLIVQRDNVLRIFTEWRVSRAKNTDEKIRLCEGMLAKGRGKPMPHITNALSVTYHLKGDLTQALKYIRMTQEMAEKEAAMNAGKPALNAVNAGSMGLYKLNEITCLIDLAQIDEAESLLDGFDAGSFAGNTVILSGVHLSRAKIAARKGDSEDARARLDLARAVYAGEPRKKREHSEWVALQVEAECDLLDNDSGSAISKLDNIIANCAWRTTVRRAQEVKDAI